MKANKRFIAIFISLVLFLAIPINAAALGEEIMLNNGYKDKGVTKIIDVPYISQNEILYGCEAVSSTMLLRYYGFYIDENDFTNNYLIKKDWHYGSDGKMYGPDPNAAFAGNPYLCSGINCGFGCFAAATAKSINKVLDNNYYTAKAIKGFDLDYLITNYIDKNQPVLVWATMDMLESRLTCSWIIDYVDENSSYKIGDTYTWRAGEHCLVLVGYDDDNYYFNDPYKSHGLIAYKKDLVRQRYNEMGKQSVAMMVV